MKKYNYFSRNGVILPVEQAVVPIADIEYCYGFGVYETVRVTDGTAYFLREHSERLIESADIIALRHSFSASFVNKSVLELIRNTKASTYNLKILLIGGATKDVAVLYVLCLSPLFPDRKLYRDGASFVTYEYERTFPHAKSLNMFHSYLAFRYAKEQNAYDALFINRVGCITEGTRTNFFCLRDKTIITPIEDQILLGVMRKVVLKVASENSYNVVQEDIKLSRINQYDEAFITSTSSKIIPVRSIDNKKMMPPSPILKDLMAKCDYFIANCNGIL